MKLSERRLLLLRSLRQLTNLQIKQLNRKQLKQVIKRECKITDRHTISSYVDLLLAKGILRTEKQFTQFDLTEYSINPKEIVDYVR